MVFARVTTWIFKDGKREEGFSELDGILNQTARHIEGFRGYMSLLSHEDQNSAVILTLWQDEELLLASEKGVFTQASEKVKDLLQQSPIVKNYRVFSTELLQRPEKKV